MWWVIFITAVLTSLLTLVLLNLHAGEKQIRYQLSHRFSVTDPQFLRCMSQLLGPGIVPGNRITALHNGDQMFPAMLAAIRGANKSITFETYIYWSGEIGKKFSEAFCERARAGVQAHVMIDWEGSGKIESKYVDELKAAGVEVELYHPLHWYNLTRLNNRTHRKLLVVDGHIGFTGALESRINGWAMLNPKTTGVIPIIALKALPSLNCRPLLPTTGSRPVLRFFSVQNIFPNSILRALCWRRCSKAQPVKAVKVFA